MSKRHAAETSRIAREDVKERIFTDTETVYRIVERHWPVTGLQIHIRTGMPHHEVFARLGDLRKQGRVVDSDEFVFLCPRKREAHTCCADQKSGERLRKTYAPSPVSPQAELFREAANG